MLFTVADYYSMKTTCMLHFKTHACLTFQHTVANALEMHLFWFHQHRNVRNPNKLFCQLFHGSVIHACALVAFLAPWHIWQHQYCYHNTTIPMSTIATVTTHLWTEVKLRIECLIEEYYHPKYIITHVFIKNNPLTYLSGTTLFNVGPYSKTLCVWIKDMFKNDSDILIPSKHY